MSASVATAIPTTPSIRSEKDATSSRFASIDFNNHKMVSGNSKTSHSPDSASFARTFESDSSSGQVIKPTVLAEKYSAPRTVLPALELGFVVQDWEGVVTEVKENTFEARLLDRTKKMKYDTEVAEIPFDEVSPDDRELVVIGGIFYLTIVRRVKTNGRQEIGSGIVFRRLPAWHESTLKRAREEASELAAFFSSGGC